MDDEELLDTELGLAADDMVAFLMKRSIGIAVIQNDQFVDLGSGTGILIGDRFFVATAAHVIEDYADDDLWLIYSITPITRRVEIATSCTTGGGPRDEIDLAYLELEPASAAGIAKAFLSLDQLQPGVCHIPDDLVVVNGYPSEYVDQPLFDREKYLSVQSMTYHSSTFASDEWPQDVSDWPHYAKPDTSILVRYPRDGNVLTSGAPFEIPKPHGMSGGGIWTFNVGSPREWSPINSRMIGIMTEWDPSGRWVLGNQVQHWLTFVADEFPELQPIIAPYLS